MTDNNNDDGERNVTFDLSVRGALGKGEVCRVTFSPNDEDMLVAVMNQATPGVVRALAVVALETFNTILDGSADRPESGMSVAELKLNDEQAGLAEKLSHTKPE